MEKLIQESTGTQGLGYQFSNWTYLANETTMLAVRGNVSLTNTTFADGNDGPTVETLVVLTDSNAKISKSTFLTGILLYEPRFNTSSEVSLPNPEAYMLTLDLCLQTFNTSVRDGVATTIMASSQSLGMTAFQSRSLDADGNSFLDSQGTASFDDKNFGFSQVGIGILRQDVAKMF